MKKVISLLCVITILFGNLLSIQANAENSDNLGIFSLSEGEYGTALISTTTRTFRSFIAVMDSSFSTANSLHDPGIKNIQQISVEKSEFLSTWDTESALKLSNYDSSVEYYQIDIENTENNSENLSRIARSFMLNHKEVKDVYYYQASYSGEAEWTGKIIMWMQNGYNHVSFQEKYEKSDAVLLDELRQDYQKKKEQVSQWESTVNIKNMTKEDIFLARQKNNLPSDYQIMKPVFDFAESITENYDEVKLTEVDIDFKGDGETIFSATAYSNAISAWDGIGDINSDEEINAADSALILSYAASVGVGLDNALTSEQQQLGDINADNAIDASDAALILQYSAYIGAGNSSETLAEFIKSK